MGILFPTGGELYSSYYRRMDEIRNPLLRPSLTNWEHCNRLNRGKPELLSVLKSKIAWRRHQCSTLSYATGLGSKGQIPAQSGGFRLHSKAFTPHYLESKFECPKMPTCQHFPQRQLNVRHCIASLYSYDSSDRN